MNRSTCGCGTYARLGQPLCPRCQRHADRLGAMRRDLNAMRTERDELREQNQQALACCIRDGERYAQVSAETAQLITQLNAENNKRSLELLEASEQMKTWRFGFFGLGICGLVACATLSVLLAVAR